MVKLEELKQKRREIDALIKEIENDSRKIVCGNARYEHRIFSTGKELDIIQIKRKDGRRYGAGGKKTAVWGRVLDSQSKDDLIDDLRCVISDLEELLKKMEGMED